MSDDRMLRGRLLPEGLNNFITVGAILMAPAAAYEPVLGIGLGAVLGIAALWGRIISPVLAIRVPTREEMEEMLGGLEERADDE